MGNEVWVLIFYTSFKWVNLDNKFLLKHQENKFIIHTDYHSCNHIPDSSFILFSPHNSENLPFSMG